MNVHIINIGDELLIGQVVNTNASWMAAELNAEGMSVSQVSVISDKKEVIVEALQKALALADAVLITGGLGPTKDDLTKHTLAEFFNSELKEDASMLANIAKIFAARGYELTETNRKQAEVPVCCTPLLNKLGTAPGMWFETEGKVVVSMPGVPFEMKQLMQEEVIPRLKSFFKTEPIIHRTFSLQGIGESFLSDKLEDFEAQLPSYIKLAYLPNAGIIRLRLSAKGENVEAEVEKQCQILNTYIKEYVFGVEDDILETVIGRLLLDKKSTLAIAESCTGGFISHLITSIPGSSAYFNGSVVSYSNQVKMDLLAVPEEILKKHGAVSKETAELMALGVKCHLKSDYALATTGIAGPDGGTDEKPVGTVWIAIATPEKVFSECYHFGNDRKRTIQRAANQALNNLRKAIVN